MKPFNKLVLGSNMALAITFASVLASAHISIDDGGTHRSRYPAGEQKNGPCGRLNGTRGTNVYTYEPGQTVTVKVKEVIPHPSYFRFAFDTDGDNGFKMPASIKPIDPTRPCPFNAADLCTASDLYNTPEVLPNMDYLAPHLSSQLPPNGIHTFQVTFPNVECTNCTLQLIQVMEDVIHGAYNPTPGHPADSYVEDNYRQCIDIVLKRSTGTGGAGGNGGGAGTGGSGGGNNGCTFGPCSVGANAPAGPYTALLALIGLGAALLRRQRRG